MNLVIVELIRLSGYFSFKKIPFKLSHSSANRSGEDERQWLIYEMLFIQEMKPKLNIQSDSIKAKLFST